MFEPDKFMFALEIEHNLQNRNDGQGRHWGASNKAKSVLLRRVRNATVLGHGEKSLSRLKAKELAFTLEEPVDLIVTRVLGSNQRKWDADSILRGDCKQLIDSIVSLGILKDDGPKYVHHVLGLQDADRREDGPSVVVEFFNAS